MRRALNLILFLSVTLVTLTLTPTPEARACGGFFCSQVPIDQVGEQIVFGVEGEKVSATIMIQYAGDAKRKRSQGRVHYHNLAAKRETVWTNTDS